MHYCVIINIAYSNYNLFTFNECTCVILCIFLYIILQTYKFYDDNKLIIIIVMMTHIPCVRTVH